MKKNLFLVLLIIVAVFVSCIVVSCSEYNPQPETEEDSWTVMFYMDMANLSPLVDLDELFGAVSVPENVNLFFITGGSEYNWNPYSQYRDDYVYPNIVRALENGGDTGHKLSFSASAEANKYQYWQYKVNDSGKGAFIPREHTPQKGMNDGYVLADFIDWCYSETKGCNTKYILFLWNHGGGSLVGMMQDWAVQNHPIMAMQDMNDCIRSTQFCKDKRIFDIVIFDMCLMQQIENMNIVREYAKCISGSENDTYASAYGTFFGYLNNNPKATYQKAAKTYCESACDKQKGYNSRTWSAIDLTDTEKLSNLCSAFDLFMKTVLEDSKESYSKFLSALDESVTLGVDGNAYDICSAASEYGYENLSDLRNTLNSTLIYNGTGSSVSDAGGLAFFFDPKLASNMDSKLGYSRKKYEEYLDRIDDYCPNHRRLLEDYLSRTDK